MISGVPSASLDLRGLNCPLPVLRTRKMLARLAHGDRLIVECTDPLAAIDIPHLLRETGDTLERQETVNGLFDLPYQAWQGMSEPFFPFFTTDPAAAAKAREALEAFCLDRAYPAPAPEAKQHRVELPPAILRWEHHGEFMTYSWEFAQEAPKAGLGTNHAQSL
jgi:tRNA 2-thiouridine synthesizing protein A